MSTLFFPTSSLNFNNIFSSESISPVSFYSKRNFGYRRFTNVDPNPLLNSILLYNKFPKFTIRDQENDNYPMVIEFDDSAIVDKHKCVLEKDGLKIFQLSGSVYFNPFTVKVHFATQQKLQTTLIKSEPSIETKLVDLYKSCFKVEHSHFDSFIWSPDIINGIEDVKEESCEKEIILDKKIDSIKGFVSCYLLGAYSALPAELLEIKQLSKEIKNIIYSLVNLLADTSNQTGKWKLKKGQTPVNELKNRLFELEKSITRILQLIDISIYGNKPKRNYELEIFTQYKFEAQEIEKVINLLNGVNYQGLTIYEYFQKAILNINANDKSDELSSNLKKLLSDFNLASDNKYYDSGKIKAEKYDYVLSQLDGTISKIEKKYQSESSRLNFKDAFSICNLRITNYFDVFAQGKTSFYPALVNEFLGMSISNVEQFKLSKIDMALSGGKIFKEFIKTSWNDSSEKIYINKLLDHIELFKPFDVKSHSNIMLQSFASFIIKGDDPEKMIDFMISNQIKDFRLSLGLWGSVFGFSAIPRTLTKEFLNSGVTYFEDYYSRIAKEILSYEFEKIDFQKSIQPVDPNTKPLVVNQALVENFPKGELPSINSEQENSILSASNVVSSQTSVPQCPICGADMVIRPSGKGNWGADKFWGCTNYVITKCRGSRDIGEESKNRFPDEFKRED